VEVCVFSADGRCWCRRVLVCDRSLLVLGVEEERSKSGSRFPGLVNWEESRSGMYCVGRVGGGHG
jgi:hypothetical protein